MQANRDFLRCDHWNDFDDFETDQRMGRPRPEVQKEYPADAKLIELVPPDELNVGEAMLRQVIAARKSHRLYSHVPLSLEELSFMLWATQGIREVKTFGDDSFYYRSIPSGGNRHALETYLSVHNVEGLVAGLYRYLPVEHKLLVERVDADIAGQIDVSTFEQSSGGFRFVRDSAVTFIWAAVPYRMEWRYHLAAHKMIAIEAGHACQNLYLCCGAVGAGACAIGAFDRHAVDKVLGVDGEDEFSLYIASVGKLPE